MSSYYLLNKPRGCVTAVKDARFPTVMECLPEVLRRGLHPVGRLDKDTEGLLLLTDDGNLDEFLLRPQNHVEKTYLFLSFGDLQVSALQKVAEGTELSGSGFRTGPAFCRRLALLTIGDCAAYLPPERKEHYLKNPGRPVTLGEIRIREGHKHQVRLMVKAAGGYVFYLRRTALGTLNGGDIPKPGQWKTLEEAELLQVGYRPGAHGTMRKFNVFRNTPNGNQLLGTFYYGRQLTYLPACPEADYPADTPLAFQQAAVRVAQLPELQTRIREGDRLRREQGDCIHRDGDDYLINRCGRVPKIDWDSLNDYQQSFRKEYEFGEETV